MVPYIWNMPGRKESGPVRAHREYLLPECLDFLFSHQWVPLWTAYTTDALVVFQLIQ